MKPENWNANKPGGLDALNLFFRPQLTEQGYPIIYAEPTTLPDRLISYKDHKKYQPGDCLHYFIDDYRFEHLWNAPRKYTSRVKERQTLTPDFSLYLDYPDPVLRWNVYRARWMGAYWQSIGSIVIPTVSWAGQSSYQYCFDGIEQGSTVAISTNGCKTSRAMFTRGFEAMIDALDPATIICYGNLRKIYQGTRNTSNVVNYPHHFGTYRGGAQVHTPLTSYL